MLEMAINNVEVGSEKLRVLCVTGCALMFRHGPARILLKIAAHFLKID